MSDKPEMIGRHETGITPGGFREPQKRRHKKDTLYAASKIVRFGHSAETIMRENPKKNPLARRLRNRIPGANYITEPKLRNGNGSKYDPVAEDAKHAQKP